MPMAVPMITLTTLRPGRTPKSRSRRQASFPVPPFVPNLTYAVINPTSFFGQLRALYSGTVLKAQLEQMRKSGAYDGFTLQWNPAYDIRRMCGAKRRVRQVIPGKVNADVGQNSLMGTRR